LRIVQTPSLSMPHSALAWLTINRPEVYNAVRGKTSDERAEALTDAAQDGNIRERRLAMSVCAGK
jgi:1,4-dihydroxy-2-naphthoyl-CoA synthase